MPDPSANLARSDGSSWSHPSSIAYRCLGLLPVIRRVWAPRGHRPTAWAHRRFEWLYVYAVVRPTTGQNWWCLLPTVSAAAMRAALAAFAQDEGIDAMHRAVLVLDGAGWPTSAKLAVPDGIDLVFLPPPPPNSNRSSASGRCATNRWRIAPLLIWTSLRPS